MRNNLLEGWCKSTLGDIARKDDYGFVDGPFGSNLPASDYTVSGIPVIRGSNLTLGEARFRDDEFVFVSRETADRLARSLCRPNDIIFTKKGTLGQTGIVPQTHAYKEFLLSSNQMKLSVDPKVADPLYVYYYVSSSASREKIIRDAEATGVPKTNLTYLRTFPILLPSLPEQRAITRILGSLDDKIELNRRMNATPEEIARAIFQSWFVDFDPVRAKTAGRAPAGLDPDIAALFPDEFEVIEGRKVPRGWEVTSLDKIANYLNGLALQKYPADGGDFLPVIKIAQMRKGNTDGSDRASPAIPTAYVVEDGDVLFSWSGSLEVMIWCGGRGALNQHLFKVTSNQFPKWFYYLWTKHHLPEFQYIAEGKVTTMGHIQRHHLTEAEVVVAPPPVMQAAHEIIAPLVDHFIANSLQARTLAALRDMLLPKLLSGELRVNDVEKMVEEVA